MALHSPRLFQAVVLSELQHVISDMSFLKQKEQLIMRATFNLGGIDDSECLRGFRFTKRYIGNFEKIIDWSDTMLRTKRRGLVVDPVLGTFVLLRRLGTISRWKDWAEEFCKHDAALNEIFYEALNLFYERFCNLLRLFSDKLIASRAGLYSRSIRLAGAPLENCIGFIDGTFIQIGRPKGASQHANYSGHKRNKLYQVSGRFWSR
jgi:hypothetical protein